MLFGLIDSAVNSRADRSLKTSTRPMWCKNVAIWHYKKNFVLYDSYWSNLTGLATDWFLKSIGS